MTDNLFNEQPVEATATPEADKVETPVVPDYTAFLAEIKDENGNPKYRTPEDAFKALKAAQEHIRTLESDNKDLRAAQARIDSLEDVVSRIQPAKQEKQDVDIASLVEQSVLNLEAKRTKEQNKKLVVDATIAAFGDKAETEFYARAEAFGLTRERANALASESPTAVFKILGIDAQKKVTPTIPTGIRTESLNADGDLKPIKIMGARTTRELTDAWTRSKEITAKRLGLSQ